MTNEVRPSYFSGKVSPMSDTLPDRIRTILLEDWDPTNASRSEYARTEYDAFIPPLIALLQSRPDDAAIVDYLYDREREITCFPGLGKERLRRPARKLLALVPTPRPQ